jgi:hypothetical protein
MPSKRTRIIIFPPTSPVRRTTSAARSKPTSLSKNFLRTTAATRPEHGRFELRQARRAYLHRADQRTPDRLVPLPGGELLSRSCGLDQFCGASGAQDFADAAFTAVVNKRAGGTGLDFRSQGVPAPNGGWDQTPQHNSRRLPLQRGHYRLGRPKIPFDRKTSAR